MTLQNVPQVTEDDLQAFHAQHFPNSQWQPPLISGHGADEASEDQIKGDESCLGWYSDGTERRLTHEQVLIFRYSEIQRLLKRFRAAQDRAESDSSNTPATSKEKKVGYRRGRKRKAEVGQMATDSAVSTGVASESNDQRFPRTQAKRRVRRNNNLTQGDDFTPRRRARELDEAPFESAELCYD